MPLTGASRQNHIAVTTIFVLLVLSLCGLTVAGCKKDNSKTEAGEISPASALSVPAEISADESFATQPLGNMKGLSVQTPPADTPPVALPDMKLVKGMDVSIRVSQRMITTPGWTQNFAALYKPVSDCLEQADGPAAVADVTADSPHLFSVILAGLDGSWQSCQITDAGGQALSLKPISQPLQNSNTFFPRVAGKPVLDDDDCKIMEPVVARPGGLIGWIAFSKPDCL